MLIVHCPDCNDPVRLPATEGQTDLTLKCPLCGCTNQISAFSNQLPPVLEIVDLDTPTLISDSGHNNDFFTELDPPHSPSAPLVESENSGKSFEAMGPSLAPEGDFSMLGSEPMLSGGFDMAADGLQPRRSKRKQPSILKLMIQTVGGGILGIGIAMLLLMYFAPKAARGVPVLGEYVADYLDSQKQSSNNKSSQTEFIPNSERTKISRQATQAQTSAALRESFDSIPAEETEASITEVPIKESELPETPDRVNAIVAKADSAFSNLIEYEGQDSRAFNGLLREFYIAAADLGPLAVDQSNSSDLKPIKELLRRIAEHSDKHTTIQKAAISWIKASNGQDKGVLLFANLPKTLKLQQRVGIRSATISMDSPITLFGPTSDFIKNMNRRVVLIGQFQKDAEGVVGTGALVQVGVMSPLQ